MMQIARLRIIDDIDKNTNEKISAVESTWNYIIDNYRTWQNKDVVPLYLTYRGIYNDISLVVSSKSADSFSEFILKNLKDLDTIKDVWMFNLIKPELFSPSENLSQNLKRFTIAIKTIPKEAKTIYLQLSNIRPTSEVIITYVTFTYHKQNNILISLLSGNRISVEDFSRGYVEGIKGVVSTEIIPIIKSKNLATSDEWKEQCSQYFKIRDTAEKDDLEIYERWYQGGFE